MVIADLDQPRGEEVVGDLGARVAFRRTDVADPAQVKNLADEVVQPHGGLDAMFTTPASPASVVRRCSTMIRTLPPGGGCEPSRRHGWHAGSRQAHALSGRGSVINIASVGGINAAPSLCAYHLSKASVIFFTKAATVGLGEPGVRVNCICRGNIQTPIIEAAMTAHLPEEQRADTMCRIRAYIQSQQPLQRHGTTDDNAEAALCLATERSSFVTGTTLPVDGGMVAGNPSRAGGISRLESGRVPG